MSEQWLSVKGYDGLYQVSDLGRIKRTNGKVLSPKPGKLGYKTVSLHMNGYAKKYLVHRLVAEAFIPNPEDKPYVNHIDGDKSNNEVSNLEWATPSENSKHSYRTHLREPIRGERNSQSKLTDEEVKWIRENVIKKDKEFGCKALAEKFGVTEPHISSIVNGKKRRM
jgi:hypothetical protein